MDILGIPSEVYYLADHARRVRDGILNTTRRYDGDNFALQSAVDDAHAIIKKAAKKSGVDHASFLSATDWYFQEQKDNGDGDEDGDESEQSADASDSSAGDEGDGDAANPGGDAGKLRSLQSRKPGTMHLKPLKETDEEDLNEGHIQSSAAQARLSA